MSSDPQYLDPRATIRSSDDHLAGVSKQVPAFSSDPQYLDPRATIRSSDDHLADVSKQVPAFAGFWYEGPRVVIAVTDGSRDSARRSMDEVRKRVHRDIGYGEPIVVSARYSFGQLKSWYEAMKAEGVFSIQGMVSGGIKETSNVIHLGFEDPKAASTCIRAVIERARVPMEAYEIEQQEPLRKLR